MIFEKNFFFEKIFNSLLRNIIPNIDLHIHTNYTDGKNTIKEMIIESKSKKIEFLLFSEHSRKNLSESWFPDFSKQIKSFNEKKVNYLVGTEVKVLNAHGELDLSSKIKKECHLVMGSVHRFPGELGDGIMKRNDYVDPDQALKIEYYLTLAALENPDLDILGHPLGMTIRRFKMYPALNYFEEIVKKCKKFNKVFEINSYYHNNLNELLNLCIKHETLISLGSNAHSTDQLGEIIKKFDKIIK
jgi:histidinol phosphatase-like PHP family hydrolase